MRPAALLPLLVVLAVAAAGCAGDTRQEDPTVTASTPSAPDPSAVPGTPLPATPSRDTPSRDTPSPDTPSEGAGRAGQREAALALLLSQAEPIAQATSLGEVTQIAGTCEAGRELGIAVRAGGADPDQIAGLTETYRTRWAQAGWAPREEGDLLTATTEDQLQLRLAVQGDRVTLVASLPCTAEADLPPPTPLSAALAHLEPQAITLIEAMVGVEQWTSTSTELPCGDDWTHTVLTLEGQVADAAGALADIREQLAQQDLPHADIAARTVAIPQADLGMITIAVEGERVTLRAQTPCRPVPDGT